MYDNSWRANRGIYVDTAKYIYSTPRPHRSHAATTIAIYKYSDVMPPQISGWRKFAKWRKGDLVRSKEGGGAGTAAQNRGGRLLADRYGWLFICRDISRGCPEKKKGGGRRPDKRMTRTCAEQERKQEPSAKKKGVEAVAAAKWSLNINRHSY